jgi:hypothetical protein
MHLEPARQEVGRKRDILLIEHNLSLQTAPAELYVSFLTLELYA